MGRPRIPESDIKHGTPSGYKQCAKLPDGPCPSCRKANTTYKTRARANQFGYEPTPKNVTEFPTPQQPTLESVPDLQPGQVEQDIARMCATLDPSNNYQDITTIALEMARVLDGKSVPSKPAAARQLNALMTQLREKSAVKQASKLRSIAQLTQREPKQTAS